MALRVVLVLTVGAAVVVEDGDGDEPAGVSVAAVAELLSVANVAVSVAAPGRCGNNDSTHCTNVFCDCFSSCDAGVVPAKGTAGVELWFCPSDAADPSSSSSISISSGKID